MTRFRGIMLGIDAREAEAGFRAHGLLVQMRRFSPLTTIAVGLAKKKVLEMEEPPVRPTRLLLPFVLGLWAVEAFLFFVSVASYFLRGAESIFWLLLMASLLWAVLSIATSIAYAQRAVREGDTSASPQGLGDALGGLYVGGAAPLLVAILLAAALFWFVLFVIWLPLIVIVLSAFTLGEAWRTYRCQWVVVEDPHDLREVGKRLLEYGAVVSRSWDTHLDETDRRRALDSRMAQYRVNMSLAIVGLSSLSLVIAFLSVRFLPEIGIHLTVATGVLTGITSIFFADALRRLRKLRSRD